MTLRARACLGLAELATGSVTDGLADLQAAVIAYRQVLGAHAPEAQVFLYDWVKAALRTGKSAPVTLAAVRALNVADLAQAAPWGRLDPAAHDARGIASDARLSAAPAASSALDATGLRASNY